MRYFYTQNERSEEFGRAKQHYERSGQLNGTGKEEHNVHRSFQKTDAAYLNAVFR